MPSFRKTPCGPGQEGIEFKELLLSDGRVKSYLAPKEIEAIFRLDNFLGNVDYIFKRTFGGRT